MHSTRPVASAPLQDKASQRQTKYVCKHRLHKLSKLYLFEAVPFSLQLPYLELHLLNPRLLRRYLGCGRTVQYPTTCHDRGKTLVSGHAVIIQARTLRVTAVVVGVLFLGLLGPRGKATSLWPIRDHYVCDAAFPLHAAYKRSSAIAHIPPFTTVHLSAHTFRRL